MSALPSAAFGTFLAPESLALGTPTTAAMEGAIQYAQSIQTAHPREKVLLVLATDGYPAGCGAQDGLNSTATVAAAVGMALSSQGLPTYVIGVGPETAANGTGIADLNTVASAGGTTSAFFLPTEVDGGGGVTTQAFLAAVTQIRGSLSCDYAIPAPPGGEALNFDAVNVVIKSASGASTTLSYSADCSTPGGWHYDNAAAPTEIELCPDACRQASASGTASATDIEFGCKTLGGLPQ